MNLTAVLKTCAREHGADFVGVADLKSFDAAKFFLAGDLLDPYSHAISVAMGLDNEIINRIADHPTPEYAEHYRSINSALDRLTSGLVHLILGYHYQTRPIPASRIMDEKNLLGSISH